MKLVILVNLMMSYYWAVMVLTLQLSMPVKLQKNLYNQVTVIYLQQVKHIAQTPAFPPVRPSINRFPTTMFGSKARSFNPLWFKSYDWLEYSVIMDACFCYPCRMFGTQGSQFGSRPESNLVTGFRDWKHATGKNGVLNGHARCFSHKH